MDFRTVKRFTECWVPDFKNTPNLSGVLGHPGARSLVIKYIGPLSRLHPKSLPRRYNIMILLSGPEPQRQYLEEELLVAFKDFKGSVLMVRGVVEPKQTVTQHGTITTYNFMQSDALENAVNSSEIII